ncbi:MAG: 4-hydroxy-tetrahydrodipicolinate synthase [Flavobacteriales bacterium]
MSLFSGLGVAMVTPFDRDGAVDLPALKRLTRHLIDGGVDFLVVHGTTGETPVLSADEKRATLDAVLEENAGQLPVVVGAGGNNTSALCAQLESANTNGISGWLSASPSYNKPSQVGIVAHYRAVAESTDLPIILYNVPGRTASNVRAETTLAVVDACANVVAVKEASGDLEQMQDILAHAPKGFSLLSGDDALTVPILSLGGHGIISVIGNAYPEQFSELVRAGLEGDFVTARLAHYRLRALMQAIFAEGNPAGVKQVLDLLGICTSQVRLPLVPASAGLQKRLRTLVDEQASFAAVSK